MFVFVDETGNTGKNLFDEAQPNFLTAALVTRTNFDVLHARNVRRIALSVSADKLHASELGFEGVEAIAEPLLKLFKRVDARFFISRVEKKYLLATKVVDHIFDSGENPSVPWHVYNIRQLRLMLVFKISVLLNETLATFFWDCLMERQEAKCRDHLVQFCEGMLSRVATLPDARSRTLVQDGLEWAMQNPHALLIHTNTKHALLGHMPNMVAFANLLEGLDEFANRVNRPVRRITHDRQSQFEKTLAAWHDLFANASAEPIRLPGEVRVLQKVPGSTFEVKTDDDSPGIQAIDVALWIFYQFTKGKYIPPRSAALLNRVMKKGYQSDFSYMGVSTALEEQLDKMFQADISEEQFAKAKAMLERSEASRQENIIAYEIDGLLPFERSSRTMEIED